MSIYVPSLREQLPEIREENSEMQNEIDLLVEQKDRAMDRAEGLANKLQNALNIVDYWVVRYEELKRENGWHI